MGVALSKTTVCNLKGINSITSMYFCAKKNIFIREYLMLTLLYTIIKLKSLFMILCSIYLQSTVGSEEIVIQ